MSATAFTGDVSKACMAEVKLAANPPAIAAEPVLMKLRLVSECWGKDVGMMILSEKQAEFLILIAPPFR